MPGKNVVKRYGEGEFYHVYNRGVNKQVIFNDKEDYAVFMNLLKRYLDDQVSIDNRGNVYENYSDRVELLAFCLMPNHFHMLLHLKEGTDGITELMRKVSGSYTTYYNKRHNRVGHLFQGVFKASRISDDSYLSHISRYIHLNPKNHLSWSYSSYPLFIGSATAGWVKPEQAMVGMGYEEYKKFVEDYVDYKKTLDDIKHQLAN